MSHVQFQYSKISEYIYLGTNMCCSVHGKKLNELGMEIDISLEKDRVEVPDKMSSFHWLPVENHMAPTISQLYIGTNLIAEALKLGKRIYIHCQNGHGRSPSLVIAHYIRTGLNFNNAKTLVKEKRPEISLTEVQKDQLKKFSEALRLG